METYRILLPLFLVVFQVLIKYCVGKGSEERSVLMFFTELPVPISFLTISYAGAKYVADQSDPYNILYAIGALIIGTLAVLLLSVCTSMIVGGKSVTRKVPFLLTFGINYVITLLALYFAINILVVVKPAIPVCQVNSDSVIMDKDSVKRIEKPAVGSKNENNQREKTKGRKNE